MSGNPGTIEPRQSVVKNVQMRGRWGTHWKTEVTLENGDVGDVFHIPSDSGVVIGDSISYNIEWNNYGPYHRISGIVKTEL